MINDLHKPQTDDESDRHVVNKSTSKDRMQAFRTKQKAIKEKQTTPQYVSYIMMHLKDVIRSSRMLLDTERLLKQGWLKESESAQKEMTSDMLENLDTSRYFVALQRSPIELPEELENLTAILRLHMLFKIINEKHDQVCNFLLNTAEEVFENLSLIDDLSELDQIDLGRHGRDFYA